MSTLIRRIRAGSGPLAGVALLMMVTALVALIGLLVDPRTVTGMPVWVKPLKFGLSTAVYAATLAWMCSYLTVQRRLTRAAAWVTSVLLVLEIAWVDIQAARGVTSHFNNTTAADSTVFGLMGLIILIVWLAGVCICVALFREPFADRAWGWSLRLGLAISLAGAAAGGAMLGPNSAQMKELRAGRHVEAVGAHTVGAPDGGPGVPMLGWSTEHGDLRVPHFFGMHAAQVLPLLAWLFRRRTGMRSVFVMAAGYLTFTLILAEQAATGHSFFRPDPVTVAALAVCVVVPLTVVAASRELAA